MPDSLTSLSFGRPAACLTSLGTVVLPVPCRARADDFEKDVAPILVRRCLECHQGGEPAGKLDLSSRDGLRAGGRGGAVIVPGKPEQSRLLHRVRDGEMPPKKQGKP